MAAFFLAVEVVSAVAEMIPPPKYIEQPVYSIHTYTIEEHSVDTSINFTLFLMDENTGRILLKNSLCEKLNLKDTFIPGSAKANIVLDPLELGSDYEIKQQLIDRASKTSMSEINSVIGQLPGIYRLKAKMEKEADNIHVAKEYSIMAAVLNTPLSSLADVLWPVKKIDDIRFVDYLGKVRIETSDSELSPFENDDVLVKINTINVMDRKHAISLLCNFEPGSLVEVVIERDSKTKKMLVINPVHSENHVSRL